MSTTSRTIRRAHFSTACSIHAAGAIEYTVGRIDALGAAVQAYADTHDQRATHDDRPLHLVTQHVDEAYFEYANLLNWLRTLFDRLCSYDRDSKTKLGLIPALHPDTPLRWEVRAGFDHLSRALEHEKYLTNFGLHGHALPGGGTPRATVDTAGHTQLLIPDEPTGRMDLFDQFTYDSERELVQFAREVLASVDIFVDELLTALAEASAQATSRPQPPSDVATE